MAGGCLVWLVVLTLAVQLSGSSPFCREISKIPDRKILECNQNKELKKWLTKPTISNIIGIQITGDDIEPTGYDFSNLPGLSYLGFTSNNLTEILPDLYGVQHVKYLNISSNNLEFLTNITQFNGLQELDLSNNSLHEVDFFLLPENIQTINLQSNRITMESNVTLPKSLAVLDLSCNNMKFIKPILSETLKHLNLSRNNISDLNFVLSLVSVEVLDLSSNNISELEDETFSTLGSLIRLDLSKNMIKFLKERSFSGLQKLQIIDLSHNLLQSVTPGTFQYLNNLLWLNLADNKDMGSLDDMEDSSILLGAGQRLQTVDVSRTNLTKVPNTLTRSIRNLYLSWNRIAYIQCGDLDSFLLLQILDLSSNRISLIEEDALGRLELLYYLLLSENSLKSIPHSLPDNLMVLDLDHNLIRNLSVSDFFGLNKLRTLRLAWNQISVISDQAFGQLSSLQNLDLSGNPIKILSSSTFIGPRKLINLGLSSLTSMLPTKTVLAFPVPESGHLQVLNMENSPVLVSQLMEDVAALSLFRHIKVLNLAYSNISSLRSDLVNFFPRLQVLDLRGNRFNCTDIFWLSRWLTRLREDASDEKRLQKIDEDSASIGRKGTDFDMIQNVEDYLVLLKKRSKDGPVCSSPQHLLGVSLFDLNPPPTTTPQWTTQRTTVPSTTAITTTIRYDRQSLNLRPVYDHEFYQNDFPVPQNELKTEDKKQTKQTNTTSVPKAEIKPFSSLQPVPTVKTLKNYTKVRGIKKTVLKATTESVLKVYNDTVLNDTKTLNDTKSSNTVQDILSIFSPLDVTVHDSDSEIKEDSELSVSSPQRISVDDLEISKDLLEEDDNDQRYTHHPGLIVFIVVAVALGIAAVLMRATQRRQSRLGYAQQQDIEVRSLDLSGQELW